VTEKVAGECLRVRFQRLPIACAEALRPLRAATVAVDGRRNVPMDVHHLIVGRCLLKLLFEPSKLAERVVTARGSPKRAIYWRIDVGIEHKNAEPVALHSQVVVAYPCKGRLRRLVEAAEGAPRRRLRRIVTRVRVVDRVVGEDVCVAQGDHAR